MITSIFAILLGFLTGSILKKLGFVRLAAWVLAKTMKWWWVIGVVIPLGFEFIRGLWRFYINDQVWIHGPVGPEVFLFMIAVIMIIAGSMIGGLWLLIEKDLAHKIASVWKNTVYRLENFSHDN